MSRPDSVGASFEQVVAETFGADIVATGTAGTAIMPIRWLATPGLVVEVELDVREGVAVLLLSRPVNGKPPSGYYLDESGRPVRWHLGALLSAIGADATALRDATRATGEQAMDRQVRLGLRLTSQHLTELTAEVSRRTGS